MTGKQKNLFLFTRTINLKDKRMELGSIQNKISTFYQQIGENMEWKSNSQKRKTLEECILTKSII